MTDIFVFGSNLAGRHGKGAALEAKNKWGAIYGQGIGLQGRSYAIPTKDGRLQPLDLDEIDDFVDEFLDFAKIHPEYNFILTPIGCGLTGYKYEQIAPLFKYHTLNVILPKEFEEVLNAK